MIYAIIKLKGVKPNPGTAHHLGALLMNPANRNAIEVYYPDEEETNRLKEIIDHE